MCLRSLGKNSHDMTIYLKTHKPDNIAGACKPSRWAVTIMDVHSVGKGVLCVATKNCDLYETGQGSSVLPGRGRDAVIGNSSFPTQFHF